MFLSPNTALFRRWNKLDRTFFVWAVCLFLFSLTCINAGSLPAQDTVWSLLADRLESARKRLNEKSVPDAEPKVVKLCETIREFDQFLLVHATPSVRETWLKYLDYETTAKQLAKADAAEQTTLAQRLMQRLARNQPGLEREPMVRLRERARDAFNALRFESKDTAIKGIDGQLSKISKGFRESAAKTPTPDDLAAASVVYSNLRLANQLPDVASSLAERFGGDNMRIHIGSQLVTMSLAQPVQDTKPINQCILGTRILGTAQTLGNVHGQLLPSDGLIRVAIVFNSQVSSQGVGYNGPVRAHTTSIANVTITKIVNVSETGVVAEPATVTSTFSSNVECFENRSRLIRRIAAKRTAQQKPQADVIARQKVEQQVSEEFSRKVELQLAERPKQNFIGEGLTVLKRLGIDEPVRRLSSDGQFVYLGVKVKNDGQLIAPNSATIPPLGYRGAIQFHESAIDNVGSTLLAGRTMTGKQMGDLLKSLKLPTSKEKAVVDSKEADKPFEIDFASFRPIIFEAREGKLKVGIRGTRFESDGRELSRPLEVVADYVPKTVNGRIILVRDGKTQVNFPGRSKLRISEIAIRRNIERQLADNFPEKLLDMPIELPESMKGIGPLAIRWIDANNGWLSLTAN